MKRTQQRFCVLTALVALTAAPVEADTYVIPFSDIQQIIDSSDETPDAAIRAYLAGLIQDELDSLGFDANAGLVLNDVPIDAITETITNDCDYPQPYKVHTDATVATVTLDSSSSISFDLDNIRSIVINANLAAEIDTEADAWVRWGQDVPFVGDCKTINTDHGWVGLTLPTSIDLSLALDLDPVYDPEQIAIVVDKRALLSGQAQFSGGNLRHDFGPVSLTDVVLSVFEDELLEALYTNGEQAVADAITTLNYKLDGLDENGLPDATIVAFNGPTVFSLDVDEQDQEMVRAMLQELGIPEYVIELVDDRGIEILLQLATLEGAEREAYLAELGATVSCDVLLGAYEIPLPTTPLYAFNGSSCEAVSASGPDQGNYFTDSQCSSEIAFRPTATAEFCQDRFGADAESTLGNAASWIADVNQPNDRLPAVPSRAWTSTPSTQLDIGVIPLQGNYQPYVKQLSYKTVLDVPRGNGTCELEIRVYKNDIEAENLAPLMALHGGTWKHRGFSFFGLEAGVSHMTGRDFIVFAPFYRLVDDSDGNEECNSVSWRELTEDVGHALTWIQQNGPALGASDEPVRVYGQSAGAHLAAWLAAHRPDDVSKALLFYAPTDVLDFLSGAVPVGGPYAEFRSSGLAAISRLYGAQTGATEIRLDQIDYSGVTVASLGQDWANLIPDAAFDLSGVDMAAPPVYLARCAELVQVDLSTISPTAPPQALTNCLKQDLSEFLIDNSFNHQLGDERVPLYLVQGAADTLVPFQQALNLCGAIDGSEFPTSLVVDPLTTLSCGTASKAQIIRDGDHALEVGACFGPLCPAGEPGSETRIAVETALLDAYTWLIEDPPPPPSVALGLQTLADASGSGAADVVVLRNNPIHVEIRDGETGALLNNIEFLGDMFDPISAAALPDSDGNGVAEIAVLATRNSDGRAVVEIRNATGVEAPRQLWFAAGHTGIELLAIEDDADGNGIPELAVLSTRDSDGRILVEVKNAFGPTNPTARWFAAGHSPVAFDVSADKDADGIPEIAVLSTRNSDGRNVVELKNASGPTNPSSVWFMPGTSAIDLATVADKDSNGIPEVVVLSSRISDGRNVVEVRNAAGAALPSTLWLATGHTALNLEAANDADSNGMPEVAILSHRDSDGRTLVDVRNVAGVANARSVWYSPGYAAHSLAISGATDTALVLMSRDSDGRIVVQGRSAAGAALSVDYWFAE